MLDIGLGSTEMANFAIDHFEVDTGEYPTARTAPTTYSIGQIDTIFHDGRCTILSEFH